MTRPIIVARPADEALTPFGVAPTQVTMEVEFRLGDHAAALDAFEAAVRDVRQQINAAALAHQAIEAGA